MIIITSTYVLLYYLNGRGKRDTKTPYPNANRLPPHKGTPPSPKQHPTTSPGNKHVRGSDKNALCYFVILFNFRAREAKKDQRVIMDLQDPQVRISFT